ncbi:MAG: ISAzo13 family transposase [Chloroflexi bacterium]|nr:ISAzo13 family transposase [Chloroflexota bacterium]
MSERKWRRSSLRALSRALGGKISHTTVGRVLKNLDYSLKANLKRLTGKPHPDRDTQFAYIEQQKQAFREAGLPIISVDTKKKELIGRFKNPGRRWCQQADAVNAHDFEQDALGKAVPYGVYDVTNNRGYVYVGRSADTPQFAVEQVATWWQTFGCHDFPEAKCLLILCDAGGSNGYRARLWKQQLQALFTDQLGLEVTVCHYPTGASKWNPIEHRLFGPISVNWAAQPLVTFEKMLALIRGMVTETGLEVEAFLVDKVYATGLKVTDAVMSSLNLVHHSVCPKWNYTIRPGSHRMTRMNMCVRQPAVI